MNPALSLSLPNKKEIRDESSEVYHLIWTVILKWANWAELSCMTVHLGLESETS